MCVFGRLQHILRITLLKPTKSLLGDRDKASLTLVFRETASPQGLKTLKKPWLPFGNIYLKTLKKFTLSKTV